MQHLCNDLEAEQRSLDDIVGQLDDREWEAPTPAEGWAVRDQISHLAYYDERGRQAIDDPDGFRAHVAEVFADPVRAFAIPEERGRAMTPAELLGWWREARASIAESLRALEPSDRMPWYGPDMGARSFATARLMETWAHGQDVADALGVQRLPTDRLRHICHLGVRTRGFSYAIRDREVPESEVRVELASPSGEVWSWGAEDAVDRVSGPAEDFCLVVTQRRHVDDTALVVEGLLARDWLEVAQAFAGMPTTGPAPRGS